MPGPPQSLTVKFGAVKTDANDRDLPPGTLTRLKNVRIDQDGALEKRNGYDRTASSTFSGGSLSGSIANLLPGDTVIAKDESHQLWARNGATNYYRGLSRDVLPTWRQVGDRSSVSPARKPLTVGVGSDAWIFHGGLATATGSPLQVTVIDGVTGATKVATALVGGIGAQDLELAAAVADGSVLWVFMVTSTDLTRILALRFNTAVDPSTADPTITTFYTNAALSFTSLDARVLPSGQILVAATSFVTSGPDYVTGDVRMFADEVTGLATGAVVETAAKAIATTALCCNGVSIIDPDGGSTVAICYYRPHPVTATFIELVHKTLNPSTLATTATNQVHSEDDTGSGLFHVGVTGGYVSGASTEIRGTIVPLVLANTPSSFPNIARDATVRHYRVGTGLIRSDADAWLASKPFKRGSEWFYVSGFHDGALAAQLSYWLRTAADGGIVAPILDGEGGQVFHSGVRTTGRMDYTQRSGHIASTVAISANVYAVALLQEDVTSNSPTPALVTLDFAAVTHSSAPGIVPGGIPKWVSSADLAAELAPLQYPYREIAVTNGDDVSALSVNRICYLFATRNARGEVRRSQPSAVQQVVFLEYVAGSAPEWFYPLAIPCERHQAPGTDVWIELYGSVNAGADLYLRARIKNDPTTASVTYNAKPDEWGVGPQGELLYTTGAPLRANSSLPSAKLAWFWKDRWWLGGIPGSREVWFSQEKQQGRGPEFNPRLVLEWHDGTGDVTAGGAVTSDVAAIFSRDAIALVSGVGPDGLGQGGGFSVQTVPGRDGCTNPASLVAHPAGVLLFQRAGDGRMCALAGAAVVDVSQGLEHLMPFTVTGAVHDSAREQILLTFSSGTVMAQDIAHPTADQPYGQWIEHTSTALTSAPALGAQLVAGAPVFLEASGSMIATWSPGSAYNDNGSEVLKDWTLARWAPAGFMGEFDADHVWLSTTQLGGNSTYLYVVTSDWATENHTDDVSVVPDVSFRCNAAYHTRELTLRVVELTATGAGRKFDGAVIEIRPYGRTKQTKRKIA